MSDDPQTTHIEGTMEAQEDALEDALHPAVDPEQLRFGAKPPPANSPSSVAPPPLVEPVGPAGATAEAARNPEPPREPLEDVRATVNTEMMPPRVEHGPSGARVTDPAIPPSVIFGATRDEALGAPAGGASDLMDVMPPAPQEGIRLQRRDEEPASARKAEAETLRGRLVIDMARGREIGHVRDVILDPREDRLGGFSVALPGLRGGRRLLPWENVHAVGRDAVMVPDAASLEPERPESPLEDAVEHGYIVAGKRLLSEDGRSLGHVEDAIIDLKTGRILGYRIAGGPRPAGARYLPADASLVVGPDVITVPPSLEGQITDVP